MTTSNIVNHPAFQSPPVVRSGITQVSDLDVFRAKEWGPIAPGHPMNIRILNAPRDHVHLANLAMLRTVRKSVLGAMYGFTDPDAARAVKDLLENPNIVNLWTFDSSQRRGPTERKLFDTLGIMDSNSVAEGTSEHGKIIHDKTMVIDGRFIVTGSTNWSVSGEEEQDNQYVVIDDYVMAADVSHDLMLIHTKALTQMGRVS